MKKLLTGLVLVPLVLIGCSGQKPEKERFVEATKEVTCMVFKSDNLFDPSLEGKSNDIFKKYGFDATNESTLKILTEKYKDDADVKKAVEEAVKECGGDLSKKFGESVVPATDDKKEETKAEVKTDASADVKTETEKK